MSSSSSDPKGNALPGFGGFFDAFQGQLQSMPALQSRLLQEMQTFNTEAMEFVQKRVEHDVEASGKLMACKTPAEAAEVMRAFYDQAFQEYSAQASHVFERALAVVQGQAEGQASDKPKKAGKPSADG